MKKGRRRIRLGTDTYKRVERLIKMLDLTGWWYAIASMNFNVYRNRTEQHIHETLAVNSCQLYSITIHRVVYICFGYF